MSKNMEKQIERTPGPWIATGKSAHGSYYKVRGTRLGQTWQVANIPFTEGSKREEVEAKATAEYIALCGEGTPAPIALPYHVTKDRPPTEADGPYIIAWNTTVNRFCDYSWEAAIRLQECVTHWMPMPPSPIPAFSAEEQAFGAFVRDKWGENHAIGIDNIAKTAWDAALAFAATQQNKGE
jgi:hypothetical protein